MVFTNSSLVTYKRLTKNKTSPRKHPIDTITIHCFVGQVTAKSGCDYFATTERAVSANYVVGYDGSIGLSVEEKDRAWCSGGKDAKGNPIRVNGISGADNDHRAVTIEVASDTKEPYTITDKAYAALIDLVTDICKRNDIKGLKWQGDKSLVGKVDKQNMTVHRWFANKACPGEYLYDRHSAIAAEVNKRLGQVTKEEETTMYRVQVGAFSKKETAEKCLANVKAAGFKDAFIVTNSASAAEKTETQPPKESEVVLKVGDKVKMSANATVYGKTSKFSSWVYKSTLYVREVSGNRVVISTQTTGAVTGAVDKKYLTKV